MVRVQGFFALVLKRLCVCIAFVPVVIGIVPGILERQVRTDSLGLTGQSTTVKAWQVAVPRSLLWARGVYDHKLRRCNLQETSRDYPDVQHVALQPLITLDNDIGTWTFKTFRQPSWLRLRIGLRLLCGRGH